MIATVTPPETPFTTGLTPWAQTLPQHISPTAAKAYLGCSLKFYFERVACIKKKTRRPCLWGRLSTPRSRPSRLARWRGTDDSPEAMKEKPRTVEVLLKEDIPGLSVPLTGAMDLVEGNFTPIDFKSAAAMPDPAHTAFDHEIQLVSYQLLLEAVGESPPSLDLVFLVKTKTPQVIRGPSPPVDAHRKRRIGALLETAVEGNASNRHHPQPGMHCSWCQFKNECMAWLPGMTAADIHQQHAA